jgi:hypothetical protein
VFAPEYWVGSVFVDLQLIRQVVMSLHPVAGSGQCSAQLVEVLRETRRADPAREPKPRIEINHAAPRGASPARTA